MQPPHYHLQKAGLKGRPLAQWALIFTLQALTCSYVAAVPVFDPFADATGSGGTSYSVGSVLTNQFNTNLFTPWYGRGSGAGGTQPTIVAGSLSYPNIPVSTGNSVSFVPATQMTACLDLNLAAQHTNTVYYSFLLKITDLSAVSTSAANNPIAGYLDDPSLITNQIARIGSRLLTRAVGSGYVLGVSKSATTTDFAYEPDAAAHNMNDVVQVVAAYQRVANVQTNVLLWVNPPLSSLGSNQPPAATVVATTGNTALNNNSARAFGIFCQFANAPSGQIDDLRVTTNWAAATAADPVVVTPPANQSVGPGNNASFHAVANGTATLSYRWIKDGTTLLSNGGKFSGAFTATLAVNNVTASELGTYAVFVTNGPGNVALSGSATLSFLTDPAITNQPQSLTTNIGATAIFRVGASGTAPLRYQWHKEGSGDLSDGGNISGSHTNVLTITSVGASDAGNYSVTVSNASGASVDSDTVSLTVIDPYITSNPVSVTTNQGGNVIFHFTAAGTGPLSYAWLKNGVPILGDNSTYFGTATDTLSVSNVSANEQAGYSGVVIGPINSATSSVANLTVLVPATVSIPPRARAVLPGVRAAFSVVASGSGPFTYQWQRNGGNISGATTTAYVVSNAQPAVAGNYTVVISNSFSYVTSSIAPLTVSNSLSLAQANLIIIRVGDGAASLDSLTGSSMFLDQFATDGTYINTVTIPDDGSTSMTAIGRDNVNGVNNGSTTGSCLSRSLDGRYMVIAGYNTNLNYGASLAASTGATVPRGIGLIDSYAQYTLPVSSTSSIYDSGASFWRAAVTDGTNSYWGAANIAGTYYFGFDAAPTLVQTNMSNMRSMAEFNGDIYCAGAGNTNGVLKITGMPTSLVTPTLLFSGSSGSFDMVVNPTGNLIYLTDQRNVGNSGGIQRWDFDGSNWNLTYTINTGFGSLGPRYIAADFSGGNPVLYVTSNDQTFDNNRLIKVVDTGAGSSGTTLAFAGANQTFRGIRFGPLPNPVAPRPTLSYTRNGNNLILSWSGAYFLQSSHEVLGTYADVLGATNPYTNNVALTNRMFFRLRN